MKKTLLTIIAILAMGATCVAQNVKDVIGTYKGDLYIQLIEPINEETEALPNQSIKLEAGNGESVDFALYNFAFGGMSLGDIILNDVGIKTQGTSVVFNDEKPVNLSFLNGVIKATAKINAETSKIEGKNIYVNLDVFWVQDSGNTPIYVRFIGTKAEATGIENIEMNNSSIIYSLNGIRMNTSFDQLPKGIYIVNGKKIIK